MVCGATASRTTRPANSPPMATMKSWKGEIAELSDLSRNDLGKRWANIYGVAPPKGARRVLLERAIAWHAQAGKTDGLSKPARKRLNAAMQALTADADGCGSQSDPTHVKPPCPRPLPTPGSRLVRDWNGQTHIVDVTSDGYVWKGEVYGSLSAIAKRITGAHWSGQSVSPAVQPDLCGQGPPWTAGLHGRA